MKGVSVEASYDLGAAGFETFMRIVLPSPSSALICAGILAFALSLTKR